MFFQSWFLKKRRCSPLQPHMIIQAKLSSKPQNHPEQVWFPQHGSTMRLVILHYLHFTICGDLLQCWVVSFFSLFFSFCSTSVIFCLKFFVNFFGFLSRENIPTYLHCYTQKYSLDYKLIAGVGWGREKLDFCLLFF